MKIALNWHSLHELYSSIIGKAIFLICLVTPIVKLNSFGIVIENYNYYLSGALLISLGFILEKIFLPSIIFYFIDPKAYTDSLLKLETEEALDYRVEFAAVDAYKDRTALLAKANMPQDFISHFPYNNGLNLLGNKKFVYFFGTLNYLIANTSKFWPRLICTALFYVGALLIYMPIIRNLLVYVGVINVH